MTTLKAKATEDKEKGKDKLRAEKERERERQREEKERAKEKEKTVMVIDTPKKTRKVPQPIRSSSSSEVEEMVVEIPKKVSSDACNDSSSAHQERQFEEISPNPSLI